MSRPGIKLEENEQGQVVIKESPDYKESPNIPFITQQILKDMGKEVVTPEGKELSLWSPGRIVFDLDF